MKRSWKFYVGVVLAAVVAVPALVAATSADGSGKVDRVKVLRERLARHAQNNTGAAKRGQALLQKLSCLSCHTLAAGVDGPSAPSLAGVGDRRTRARLIQKILYPSSSITPGWQRVTLTLRDGKVVTGRLLGSPSANPIRLFDDQGQFRAIPVAKVAQQSLQTTSDMPEGLGDGLTPEQFLDLIEALSSLKKTAAAQ